MVGRSIITKICVGACMLALAACGTPSTPVVSGGRYGAVPIPRPKPGESSLRPVANVASSSSTTFVQTGETLADVAARTGTTTRELIEANGLSAPFKVRPGQQLRLPVPPIHIVQAGDTASSLSRRYGISVGDIIRRNNISPPYLLKTGQRLILPPGGRSEMAPPAPPIATAASPAVPQISSPPPATIQNQPTTSGGGASASVSRSSLPPLPPMAPPAIGPEPLPPAKTPPRTVPTQPLPALPTPVIEDPPAMTAAVELAPTPAPAVEPALPPSPPVQVALAPKPAPPPVISGKAEKFVWPVQSGEVISRFGTKPGGLHNDGVNIAAREGTAVLAAGDGTVAYAGQELKGFGNLILIRHANGWMSAYAHNDGLLVARGDQVRRGQPIARMGQTGDVDRPQLHFELRQETEAVDPLRYLPKTGNRPRMG